MSRAESMEVREKANKFTGCPVRQIARRTKKLLNLPYVHVSSYGFEGVWLALLHYLGHPPHHTKCKPNTKPTKIQNPKEPDGPDGPNKALQTCRTVFSVDSCAKWAARLFFELVPLFGGFKGKPKATTFFCGVGRGLKYFGAPT